MKMRSILKAVKKGAISFLVSLKNILLVLLSVGIALIIKKWKKEYGPITDENWNLRAAKTCETIADTLLNKRDDFTDKTTSLVARKVGALGLPATVFSFAGIFGTASTGTAISTLSGAALNSATLAWIGGSVLTGGVVLAGVGVVGAAYGPKAYRYARGKLQSKASIDLSLEAEAVVVSCRVLSQSFRAAISNPSLARIGAIEGLKELSLELQSNLNVAPKQDWSFLRRQKFLRAKGTLAKLASFRPPNLVLSRVMLSATEVVLLKFVTDATPYFSTKENLVLDALRRSKTDLKHATETELGDYFKSLSAEQQAGLHNNIKGILHELRYAADENSDNDEFIVEIYKDTNHAGSDVRVINTLTGEEYEYQLKATDSFSYVQEHLAKYPEIAVVVTSELANENENLISSGISNADLNSEVDKTFLDLMNSDDDVKLNIGEASGLIYLTHKTATLLKNGKLDKESTKKTIAAASLFAVIHSLI